jgi:hypothetical protein
MVLIGTQKAELKVGLMLCHFVISERERVFSFSRGLQFSYAQRGFEPMLHRRKGKRLFFSDSCQIRPGCLGISHGGAQRGWVFRLEGVACDLTLQTHASGMAFDVLQRLTMEGPSSRRLVADL